MTIVVGYFDSPEGNAALRRATEEATVRSTDLVVVPYNARAHTAARQAAGNGSLKAEVVPYTDGADIVDEVLDRVRSLDAQMLVIGLRQRSRVGKLLLGSSAQRLLLDAPCPVLTVKPS